MVVTHLVVDVRDAMSGHAVNTMAEALAPEIEEVTGGEVELRILSNLADRRLARASCRIPPVELETDATDLAGEEVRDRIVDAWAFAAADPYRAATHNKGIMNGIDAVATATFNDWRAIEAGAHACAAQVDTSRSRRTRSTTTAVCRVASRYQCRSAPLVAQHRSTMVHKP